MAANSKKNGKNMLARVQTIISARVPVIWFLTGEEQRAESGLANLAKNMDFKGHKGICAIWSLTSGVDGKPGWTHPDGWLEERVNGKAVNTPIPDNFAPSQPMAGSPHGAILQAKKFALENKTQPMILVVRDAHMFMGSDPWRRALKDCARELRNTLTTVVLVSVSDQIKDDLRRHIALVKPGLPSVEVLTSNAKNALAKLGAKGVHPRECALALRGLGVGQATDLIKLDFVEHGSVDPERLSRLKAEELASVHGVSFEGEAHQMGQVGGLDHYKRWLNKRIHAFTQKARERGIDEPKGCVFVGVPGGGKTLTARAIAATLKQPLIVLNLSECEGGIVGETATRMAEALRTVDALAPCTVLIDEIEKALGSGGEHDGGSKRTLVRLLLIWLQERQSQVFTCITSNDISGLPPELTRKGRVDEIWFVDLPNQADRETILKIHLNKRSERTLPAKAVKAIAGKLAGFTGSEIEESVKEAILTAWARYCEGEAKDDTVTTDDVVDAAKDIVPMSVTYEAKLAALRDWAKGRARRASDPDPDQVESAPLRPQDDGEAPAPGTPIFNREALTDPW